MTNPVNQQKQIPSNYSGVTINITNPTVNAGMQTCTYPQREPGIQVIKQDNSEMYGLNQPNVPYYYNSSDSLKTENVYNTGTNYSTVANPEQLKYADQQVPRQVQQAQYPQYNQPQQQVGQTQYQQVPQQVQQAQAVQQNQPTQVTQPAQYYLNNYNYNGVGANGEPITQTGIYTNAVNMPPQNDMSASEGIIKDLSERDAKQKELEEKSEKKKVVALTNEYIMSLENYLNNPNTDIRLMAAKEILTRLDEDRSRCDDAALNALLNKMLQDPEKIIRIAAMSALSSGLAMGNDYTMKLLNKIQQDPNADKEDVLEVSQILLRMSETSEERYVPVKIKNEEAQNNA